LSSDWRTKPPQYFPSFVLGVLCVSMMAFLAPVPASADESVPPILRDVGFVNHLGARLPLNQTFRDERGQLVRLGDYVRGKPVVLTLNDFDCPNLCPLMLDSIAQSMAQLTLTRGDQYVAITVSINPRDTPLVAAQTRQRYVLPAAAAAHTDSWHFLTGDAGGIAALTKAVGFSYAYDPRQDEYAHPTGVIVLTGEGQIARYLYGLDFPTRDLRLALVEASLGQIGSPVDQLLLTCYHYDPSLGRYSDRAMGWIRLGGAAILLGLAGFLGSLWYRDLRQG